MRIAVNASIWKPTSEEWDEALGFVAQWEPTEAARIARFRMDDDRKRSLLGRLLLRFACSSVLNISADKLRFARTPENKPICLDLQGQVNISHHGAWVVLALELNCKQVGVDVTRYDHPKSGIEVFFTSMQRQFTPQEWKEISTSLERFYQHWALKEALIKAMGIGLGFDLQRASFRICEEADIKIELEIDGMKCTEWDFYLGALDDTHCVAVALSADRIRNQDLQREQHLFQHLHAQDLVNRFRHQNLIT